MESGWKKNETVRVFANGDSVRKIDYTNTEQDTIGGIRQISLLQYPHDEYQFIVEDKNARLINHDPRFSSNLMQTLFHNPHSYICKTQKISDKGELENLISSIASIEDISEIELDLCLEINPHLTDSDILEYFNKIEEGGVFEETLNAVQAIKKYAPAREYIIETIAQQYINDGLLSKAFAIYEVSLDEGELVEKAREFLSGLQDATHMPFGEGDQNAEQFREHLDKIVSGEINRSDNSQSEVEVNQHNPSL